jgi:hypothetical protein
VRQGFGESSIEKRGETASSMMVAQARAEIEARYVMAMQRPRDNDNVRVRLLRECQRPAFAKKAFYSVPRGDKPGRISGISNRLEGLSIRFAEAAIRIAGNIWQPTRTVYDDDFKRMLNVAAIDLETNAIYSRDVVIEKTIERRKPKDGAVILGKRTNSAGDTVYILQATEEELLQKESNLVSRTLRTEALRLIGADILEESEQQIIATIRAADAADPDGARKEIADAFASLNILPSDLKAYLGHELDMCSPAQLTDLRAIYAAIREGEFSWAQAMQEKIGVVDETETGKGAKAASRAGSVASSIAARVEKQKAAAAEAKKAEEAKKAGAAPKKGEAEKKEDRPEVKPPANAGDAWEGES